MWSLQAKLRSESNHDNRISLFFCNTCHSKVNLRSHELQPIIQEFHRDLALKEVKSQMCIESKPMFTFPAPYRSLELKVYASFTTIPDLTLQCYTEKKKRAKDNSQSSLRWRYTLKWAIFLFWECKSSKHCLLYDRLPWLVNPVSLRCWWKSYLIFHTFI